MSEPTPAGSASGISRLTFSLMLAVLTAMSLPIPLSAQNAVDPYHRGVPTGSAAPAAIRLSLTDAIARGLEQNLGGILASQKVRSAEGARLRSVGATLPRVTGDLRDSVQVVNLAAFGFTGFPGVPPVIGPFQVLDARLAVSSPLIDLSALNTLRADDASLKAEQFSYKSAREDVILIVADLYFQALADASRARETQAEVTTAETLERLAEDQRAAGVVAGIEVLQQQVQLASARQRQIVADAAAEKDKLVLARAIGLPAGQAIDLSDTLTFVAAPTLTLDQAAQEAASARDDIRSAEARLEAATASRRAKVGEGLPSLRLDADYGALGSSASTLRNTYSVAATLKVPIFEGGTARGRVEEADADMRQREAELADLKAGVRYELAGALLDIKAAEAAVDVARNAQLLSQQQVEQAQDRFRAGVGSSIELVQAQEAQAAAADRYIASLFAHDLTKAALARALGAVDTRLADFLGGH